MNKYTMEEIILENRIDLVDFLKNTEYEYVILKFSATWCNPCKVVKPMIENILKEIDIKIEGSHQKYIFIEVDVDECFDLYGFLKYRKMINGIPALFLYCKQIYKDVDDDKLYIPQASISGTKEDQIKKVLHLIQ